MSSGGVTAGFALFLLIPFATPAVAQAAQGQGPDATQAAASRDPDPPSFRAFARGLGMSFTTSLFSSQNLMPLVAGAGTTAILVPFDQEISSRFLGTADSLGTVGTAAGGVLVVSAVMGGTVLAAQISHNRRLDAAAFALAQTVVVENAIVESAKYITRRERPDGSDNLSFPSSHAANAFGIATVVAHYCGWRWGVPAYAVAGAIAISRVEAGKHWPSDVAAGATIGLLAGRSGIRTTERLSGARPSSRVSIVPVIGARRCGVFVSILPSRR
jgi:membrane-associated phospholipid phosphatase